MCEKFFTQIISRKDAKSVGSKFYYTGKPCKNGHVAMKRVCSYRCLICEQDKQGSEEYKERCRKYYKDNKDRIDERNRIYKQENYDKCLASQKRYCQNNKERLNKTNRDYYYENIESIKVSQRKWYEENRQHVLERERKRRSCPEYKANLNKKYRERYKKDVNYKMQLQMRDMVSRALKGSGQFKTSRTAEALGYGSCDLVGHLESRMLAGMSWDNYGDWHIDHIKPIKNFLDSGISDPAVINRLDNLCCMWADHNVSKSDKTLEDWLSEKGEYSEEWNLYSRYL